MRIPGLRMTGKLALAACGAAMAASAVRWGPADYFAMQAQLAAQSGDTDQELAYLTSSLRRDPANAESWYRRGLALLKPGINPSKPASKAVLVEAEDAFRRAVELNPWHYLYPVALTDILDANARPEEAFVAAQMAIRAAPWHEEARLALAMHYARTGQFADAEKAFLWAGKASAKNRDSETTWFDYYQQMIALAARFPRR